MPTAINRSPARPALADVTNTTFPITNAQPPVPDNGGVTQTTSKSGDDNFEIFDGGNDPPTRDDAPNHSRGSVSTLTFLLPAKESNGTAIPSSEPSNHAAEIPAAPNIVVLVLVASIDAAVNDEARMDAAAPSPGNPSSPRPPGKTPTKRA